MASTSGILITTEVPGLTRLHSGKVRDIYALPDDRLLLVATDRVSTFDVVLPTGIPRKGEVLTRLSAFWYERTKEVVPSAFIAVVDASNARKFGIDDPALFGRSMVMRRAEPLKVECVVRGYLAGSAWAEYERSRSINGIPLQPGLRKSAQLIEPIFTPTTKAEPPAHDAPMPYAEVEEQFGAERANALRLRSLALYRYGASVAREHGVLMADTKFEFGLLDGEVTLIDEVMTPDSSRLWPAEQYRVGEDQPSFDKQPLRDWLERQGWDKQPPGPELPPEVVRETSHRYLEAYRRLTGHALPD